MYSAEKRLSASCCISGGGNAVVERPASAMLRRAFRAAATSKAGLVAGEMHGRMAAMAPDAIMGSTKARPPVKRRSSQFRL